MRKLSREGEVYLYMPFIVFMSTLNVMTILEMFNVVTFTDWKISMSIVFTYLVLSTTKYAKIQIDKFYSKKKEQES